MMTRTVIAIAKTDVRVVRQLVPAHQRYYIVAGLAVGERGEDWLVLVQGVADLSTRILGVVLIRR